LSKTARHCCVFFLVKQPIAHGITLIMPKSYLKKIRPDLRPFAHARSIFASVGLNLENGRMLMRPKSKSSGSFWTTE